MQIRCEINEPQELPPKYENRNFSLLPEQGNYTNGIYKTRDNDYIIVTSADNKFNVGIIGRFNCLVPDCRWECHCIKMPDDFKLNLTIGVSK